MRPVKKTPKRPHTPASHKTDKKKLKSGGSKHKTGTSSTDNERASKETKGGKKDLEMPADVDAGPAGEVSTKEKLDILRFQLTSSQDSEFEWPE
jgi:hypothetical protein